MLVYIKLFFSAVLFLFAAHTLHPKYLYHKTGSGLMQDAVNFGAISDGKKVIASWTIPNERNFDYFTIEKSKDGINFVTALMIKGAGKVSAIVDYTDIDYSPFSGISYYRLKQTDYFGEVSYSEAVVVNFQLLKDGTIIPYTEKMLDDTELKEMENKVLLVVVRDSKGQEHITKIRVTSDNEHLYAADTRNSLSPGAYTVIASSYNRLCSHKLLVK
jgi:hypothetical protein